MNASLIDGEVPDLDGGMRHLSISTDGTIEDLQGE